MLTLSLFKLAEFDKKINDKLLKLKRIPLTFTIRINIKFYLNSLIFTASDA